MRAVDEQGRNPLALRHDVRRLIEVEFESIHVDANRSQTRARLIENANLLADESDRYCIVERVGNMQRHVVGFSLRPIAAVDNAFVGIIVHAGVDRRGRGGGRRRCGWLCRRC